MTTVKQDKPSLEYLTHHGVKGMKWGVVRKNLTDIHVEKVSRGLAVNERVAGGTGSKIDKTRVIIGSPGARLLTRGVKGTAQKNAEIQRAHIARLNAGKATVSDLLSVYGHATLMDVANAGLRTRQSG